MPEFTTKAKKEVSTPRPSPQHMGEALVNANEKTQNLLVHTLQDFADYLDNTYNYYELGGRALTQEEKDARLDTIKMKCENIRHLYNLTSDKFFKAQIISTLQGRLKEQFTSGFDGKDTRQVFLEIDEFFQNIQLNNADTNDSEEEDVEKEETQEVPTDDPIDENEVLISPPSVTAVTDNVFKETFKANKAKLGVAPSEHEVVSLHTSLMSLINDITSRGRSKMMAVASIPVMILSGILYFFGIRAEYFNAEYIISNVGGVSDTVKASAMAMLIFIISHVLADLWFKPKMQSALRNNEGLANRIPFKNMTVIIFLIMCIAMGGAYFSDTEANRLSDSLVQNEMIDLILVEEDNNFTLQSFQDDKSETQAPSKAESTVARKEEKQADALFWTYIYMILYGGIAMYCAASLWAVFLLHLTMITAEYKMKRSRRKFQNSHSELLSQASRLSRMRELYVETKALEAALDYRESIYGRSLN